MSISKVLEQDKKDVSDSQKLSQIVEMVAAARSAYGNEDIEIKAPVIGTVNGDMDLKFVCDATKLVLVKNEVTRIKVTSIEACKSTEGVNMKKVIEELVATSPVLVNLSDTTDFTYL